MKIEFDFDTKQDIVAVEGIAVLSCLDENNDQIVLYGIFGQPTSLTAIGMYTVALEDAKLEFKEGEEFGD